MIEGEEMAKNQAKPASARNAAYRARMRAQGFRQVQMWVPNLRQTATLERYKQAAIAIRQNGDDEAKLMAFVEDVTDWSDI
jgi:hypothetical protein